MCKEMGVRTRFSNRGRHQVLSQMLLDMGRACTPIMARWTVGDGNGNPGKGHRYFRTFSDPQIQDWLDLVVDAGIDPEDTFKERPEDFIFHGDEILTVSKKYLLRAWKKHLKPMIEMGYCLATPANPAIGSGEDRETSCLACGFCETKEEVDELIRYRSFDDQVSWEDVLVTFAKNKPKFRMRFGVKVPERFSFMSKERNARYHMSRILRTDDDLVEAFHSIDMSTSKWTDSNGATDQTSGLILVDMLLKKELDPEHLNEIAASLKVLPDADQVQCSEWMGVYKALRESPIKLTDYAIYAISMGGRDHTFKEAVRAWDGKVKLAEKSPSKVRPVWIEEDMSDVIPEPLLYENARDTGLVVALPLKVNPHAFLMSLIRDRYIEAFVKRRVTSLMFYRPVDASCAQCGGKTHIDLFSGRISKFCNVCIRKTIVLKLKKITAAPRSFVTV